MPDVPVETDDEETTTAAPGPPPAYTGSNGEPTFSFPRVASKQDRWDSGNPLNLTDQEKTSHIYSHGANTASMWDGFFAFVENTYAHLTQWNTLYQEIDDEAQQFWTNYKAERHMSSERVSFLRAMLRTSYEWSKNEDESELGNFIQNNPIWSINLDTMRYWVHLLNSFDTSDNTEKFQLFIQHLKNNLSAPRRDLYTNHYHDYDEHFVGQWLNDLSGTIDSLTHEDGWGITDDVRVLMPSNLVIDLVADHHLTIKFTTSSIASGLQQILGFKTMAVSGYPSKWFSVMKEGGFVDLPNFFDTASSTFASSYGVEVLNRYPTDIYIRVDYAIQDNTYYCLDMIIEQSGQSNSWTISWKLNNDLVLTQSIAAGGASFMRELEIFYMWNVSKISHLTLT